MVISWTPSGAVVTTPTPARVVGAASGGRGLSLATAEEQDPRDGHHSGLLAGARASLRAVGGKEVLLLIAGEPYASEARQARDRPPSARRNPPPRRRPAAGQRERPQRRRRQRPDVALVPRLGQARRLEDRLEQPGGETPDQHVGDRERRPDEPRRVRDAEPVGRVGEVGQRDAGHARDLAGVADQHVPRVVPPADHGDDEVVRGRQEQLLQGRQHPHAGRVDARLLLRLAQRRPDRVVVARIDPATRERRLAGVAAQVRRTSRSAARPGRSAPRRTG